jgi:hypothetical protein
MSFHAVASPERQPEARIDFLKANVENNILMAETVQIKSDNIFEDELNHNVLCEHKISVLIDFASHLPRVHAHGRNSFAIQVQTDDFGVMKIRPISKPIVEFGSAFYFSDSVGTGICLKGL